MEHHTLLVLSRDIHHAGLIARTLRSREVRCLPLPFDTPAAQVLSHGPRGIILFTDSHKEDALDGLDFTLLACGVPILALGGAAAVLCAHFGGSSQAGDPERSAVTLSLSDDPLFQGIASGERMLSDLSELALPEVLVSIATATERSIGFRHQALPLHAIQYPIERNDPDGAQLLYNFATNLCGVTPDWTDEAIIRQAVGQIRQECPEGRVLCAVSGGVDSSVCAKLASMAVGDRLSCMFVDTGLFREGEPADVQRTYLEKLGLSVKYVDASDAFLQALSGVRMPRDKERAASALMTQVVMRQLTHDPEIRTIIMGTNFNDTLLGFAAPMDEKSESPYSAAICEPIRTLFKEEVRRLAVALGLPPEIANRQPFPSSGLALRVMSAVTEDKLRRLRAADAWFSEEIREGGYDRRLWQYYATLVESPDVPDGYAVCLRATQAAQGGAYAARMPFDVLERAAQRILSGIPGVTRVVYDLTPSAHYGELE